LRRRVQRSIPCGAEGGKEPLRAEYSAYTMGSDHDVYQDSSFGIPAIYLNDWPDRYIHYEFRYRGEYRSDEAERAAFIGRLAGIFWQVLVKQACLLSSVCWSKNHSEPPNQIKRQRKQVDSCDGGELQRFNKVMYARLAWSVSRLMSGPMQLSLHGKDGQNIDRKLGRNVWIRYGRRGIADVYRRNRSQRALLLVFGYDYFSDHVKTAGVTTAEAAEL